MIIVMAFALAGATDFGYGRNPAIDSCERSMREYSNWAVEGRNTLDSASSDRNGPVDQSKIVDANYAFGEALIFVQDNIQFVERASARGEQPSAAACREVVHSAKIQIESYLETLIRDIPASDREGRYSLRQEFRMGLRRTTARFQGR